MVSTQIEARGIHDDHVLQAMRAVLRHRFMPESQSAHAYEDRPLPIGYDQTISQPYIVALMTQLAGVTTGDTVLEVGTGSGYQAAVLAEMGVEVFSVEIIEPLSKRARAVLSELGYASKVQVRHGDGYAGWPEHAPFDGIIVTAAADKIPPPLLQQLKPGGKLVIPVGAEHGYQELLLVEVDESGEISKRSILPVRFVPLTGDR